MKTIRIITALLIVMIVISITSRSQVPESKASAPEYTSVTVSPSSSDQPACRPNTGWKWTYGSTDERSAEEARQALLQLGIEATVVARQFGETDSCGSFRLYATDFTVSTLGESRAVVQTREELQDTIIDVLTDFGRPRLGNVRIRYSSDGDVVVIRDQRTSESAGNDVEMKLTTPASSGLWSLVPTNASPPGRYTHGFAYDVHRNVAVLFGGDSTGSSRLNDTWELAGTNWANISSAQSPPGRANIDQTMVYDSVRRKVVLFGGLGASGYLNDTWEYDQTGWNSTTGGAPESRDSHAMTFDTYREVAVLFGGYSTQGALSDTWEYDGTWQQAQPDQSPTGRSHHSIVYDAQRGLVVLFGGRDSTGNRLGDTWEYDGTTWTRRDLPLSPSARYNHSITYDSTRNLIVLFGGEDSSGVITDTWEYNGTTWYQVSTSESPSIRKEMSLIYSPQRETVMFFAGGYWGSSLVTFSETWEYASSSSQLYIPLVLRSYSAPEVVTKDVYVIVYDPVLSNGQDLSDYLQWNDHAVLTPGIVDFFHRETKGELQYRIAYTTVVTDGWPIKVDGFRYSEAEYLAAIDGTAPFHSPDAVDYNAIVNSAVLDICGKANRGEIDEVWIYNGPGFGFYESTLVGPGAYWYNSPPVPGPHGCNRLIPIMGPSPERGLNCAIENFGHRMESTMVQVYGSWDQNRTAHGWDKFALVKALSPSYSYSGCGNIHYPPNGIADYDYANLATVSTNCDDFANYPNLANPLDVVKPVDCTAWGCDHLEYFSYWFGHLPSNDGCDADSVSNNWWTYFINPALANNPSSVCQ